VRALVRWLAAGLDAGAVAFLLSLLGMLAELAGARAGSLAWLWVPLLPVYFLIAWTRYGRTFGMAAFHLQLVPMDRAGLPSLRQGLARLWATWRVAAVSAALLFVLAVFDLGALVTFQPTIGGRDLADIAVVPLLAFLAIGLNIVWVFVAGMWAGARAPRRRTRWDRRSRTEVVLRTFAAR
jgi:uncharacterized RDD family membrane protein YckC